MYIRNKRQIKIHSNRIEKFASNTLQPTVTYTSLPIKSIKPLYSFKPLSKNKKIQNEAQ
eukprot:Pgem_evm1s8292